MSATAANPLIDGYVWASSAPSRAPSASQQAPQVLTSSASDAQGTRPLGGAHNTPLHIAVLLLLAVAGIWGLHAAGFRFATTVQIGD